MTSPFDLSGDRRKLSVCGELSPLAARVQNKNVCFLVGFVIRWVGELSAYGEQFVSVALFDLSEDRQELPACGELSMQLAACLALSGSSSGQQGRLS